MAIDSNKKQRALKTAMKAIFLFVFMFVLNDVTFPTPQLTPEYLIEPLQIVCIVVMIGMFLIDNHIFIKARLLGTSQIREPFYCKLLKVTEMIFRLKVQKEIFEPIASDWQDEYFEALSKNEIWRVRCINVIYTYAFLVAMWQKSPIGDLLEFVSKFAK